MATADLRIGNVLETKRGNVCVVVDNFKFSKVNVLKSGDIRFRCTNRACNANVIVNERLDAIVRTKCLPHSHPALADDSISLEVVRTAVKRKGARDLHTKPNAIITTVIRREGANRDDFGRAKLRLVRKSLYTVRKRRVPGVPRSLRDALDVLGDRTYVAHRGQRFCHVSACRTVVVFTCAANLVLLCENGERVFGDGTHGTVPRFFRRLYTVHVQLPAGAYVPVAYCLLAAKRRATYAHMWTEIRGLCVRLARRPLAVRRFYADLERNAHAAVVAAFPGCRVRCCFFHVARAVHAAVHRDPALRKHYGDRDSDVGNWLKYFYGLAFLPPSEVGNGFTQLMSIAPPGADHVTRFSDHILDTYVTEDSDFPPRLWAAQPTVRDWSCVVTDGPASFRSDLERRFYVARPNVYHTIGVLEELQTQTEAELRSIADGGGGALRRKGAVADAEGVLHKRWAEYERGEISQLIYVMVIGHVFQAAHGQTA